MAIPVLAVTGGASITGRKQLETTECNYEYKALKHLYITSLSFSTRLHTNYKP